MLHTYNILLRCPEIGLFLLHPFMASYKVAKPHILAKFFQFMTQWLKERCLLNI